ncbi:biotin carboxylase N-terminal domain-containing protein [Nocardioides sp. P86]|uniref:ATP-binding protein n=1 Tax=Nocardioides sp. P86 TaxID=2939569 RepID=UPI00203B692C|nr:biotin carboxylase N-terminal domain-containing protein [Nocardioides sp. P86]MCM3516533.1 ATP-grasp domain-containing protein [Nocardioides sp. P86]
MTIHTLLVANRGEIALRVFRTAARLGLRTVAIHTDLDATAPHVRAADAAVRVESYLDVDAVVAAAVAVGADAVHPGYGFLSERAAFARALEAAGVVLVGPSAEVMDRMGRKDAAREIAVAAGVPVVPTGEDAAYPVLVKAAAGGGGKGMRVVRSAAELEEATAAARREALAAFGDDTMLVEKYVERGRHVEVQVLGDAHGTVLHLFERDCSTQRRHQKVLEEAPAPTLDEATRARVRQAGVDLAAHVGYTGAGTVEFLLDADTGEFYFLEMNTRLQVEHPVSELVARVDGAPVDLVELQLRVAAGEPVGLAQDDLTLVGHAIEARVYAEDAYAGFLPQAGRASLVRWPAATSAAPAAAAAGPSAGPAAGPAADPRGATVVRVDHALADGQVVSTAFDPMLGKVVVHGPDRESARRALVAALDRTAILGLTTNAGFLRALVASEEFRDATIDTAWLDRHELPRPEESQARVVAAWTQAMLTATGGTGEVGETGRARPGAGPFHSDGFRLGGPPAPQRVGLDRPVVVERAADGLGGAVDGVRVVQLRAEHHTVLLDVDGERLEAVVDARAHEVEVVLRGQRHVFRRPDPAADRGPAAGDGTLVSPMPGTVLDVRVVVGQEVAEGDVLGVVEAMKMELALRAPFAGTVTEVDAVAGRQVALGATLFVVEAAPDAPGSAGTGADSAGTGAPSSGAPSSGARRDGGAR